MIRSTDVAALNDLLNDPRVRPNMGGDGVSYIDGAPILERGLFYLSERGGMCFHPWGDTIEGHFLFTEGGKRTLDLALGMVRACVLETQTQCLWGRIFVGNRPARLFTRKLGFVSLGIKNGIPPRPDLEFEIFVWGDRAWDSLVT